MIVVSPEIQDAVIRTQGVYFEPITGIPREKIGKDLLDAAKPREQLALLRRHIADGILHGKRLLEIGSGVGMFQTVARLEFGMDAWGVEPETGGFDDSYAISKRLLSENGLDPERIINATGEQLPFPDDSFDIVYSTNVLEHVDSPIKVLSEAIRVCRPGGSMQIITPNFGSWFDGHYACFYFPYQPKWFWKWWIKHVLKRNPSFADTLRTEINYFSLRAWIKPYIVSGKIEVLDYGEVVFRNRIEKMQFTAYAGLGKVKRWVELLHKLKLERIAGNILVATGSFSPLILTIRKKL
jgi:ubiquinone/menaquinone biosynthesis C-methylase UbiE